MAQPARKIVSYATMMKHDLILVPRDRLITALVPGFSHLPEPQAKSSAKSVAIQLEKDGAIFMRG